MVSGKQTLNDPSMLELLKEIKGKGILFGHQDDLAYGIGWAYQEGESDVKRVAGDYPALFGWELGGLELERSHNLDSVPFIEMKNLVIKAHKMGGINTFSWHPYSPVNEESSWDRKAVVVKHIIPGGSHHEAFKKQLDKVAVFFKSLKDENGNQIPFIFRPWHEMDGSWFWWGNERCDKEEFKKLFSFTVTYLRTEKGLKDMLIAYSPDRNFNSAQEYFQWYPGDQYIEILGVDNYWDLKQKNGELEAIRKLHIVIQEAKNKNKLAAFTETGLENVTDKTWYTAKLGKVLEDPIIAKEISYVMVWRNDQDIHYFFPYPGHPAAEDAETLLKRPNILLLQDFLELKQRIKN
jgi:beta-mannanase